MFKKKPKDTDDTLVSESSVVFYGAPWCAPCNQLKRQLEDEKIAIDFKNVDEKQNETAMLDASGGKYLIPTVVVGDRIMQNPPIAMVKDALK